MSEMKLEGVMTGQEYIPARGIYNGIPYQIVPENGRLVLHIRSGATVITGMIACPVGVLGENWQGVYSWDAKEVISTKTADSAGRE